MHPDDQRHNITVPFILSILNESEEDLRAQGIDAGNLLAIYNDYISRRSELEDIAIFISNTLKRHKAVYGVQHRVKEPLHLLKKIIRKKQEYPDRNLNAENYLDYINDLAGVRILHLYKEDWHDIGNYIQQIWELKREPYIYIKSEGTLLTNQFTSSAYKVIPNDRGYNAQHYIAKVKACRQQYFVEIQVKTLFEEGWSEIDHCVRYPDHEPNELLHRLLGLLNKFTASADAVASQIQALSGELHKYKSDAKPKVTTAQLRSHINKLPVDEQEKQYLYACLDKLTSH
ncbi:ppGpp synthetase/RelA/SpoT-type nucleotidyltransferase [Pontibacter aydingkolensis]|uniref:RelA/SpoT domain-containing protein n=1 Tax=Pontibacter aydingkolensis TaxID=1911536 RepID=A0ABS7CQQ2_9BACT|nr:RelA/SpoT domain-containing protein [Pontibacter aydingkolensis]MBW7466123.1 RelA/SpoT domain-containing protein [Pontibacter aydingkolensis]